MYYETYVSLKLIQRLLVLMFQNNPSEHIGVGGKSEIGSLGLWIRLPGWICAAREGG